MEQSENQPDLPEKNGSARMAERNRLLSVLLNVSNLSAQDADPRVLGDAVLERLHGLLFCDASLCYLVQGKRLVHIARKGRCAILSGGIPCSIPRCRLAPRF
jgi:hypothetical protein